MRVFRWIAPAAVSLGPLLAAEGGCSTPTSPVPIQGVVALPSPRTAGSASLDSALARRRSVRSFAAEPLRRDEIGQLAWAAQGVTDASGHRTAPSAGALYPLELYLFSPDGVFHYVPASHALEQLALPDRRPELADAALDQAAVREAALVVLLVGVPSRSRPKYGEWAQRFVTLEAGHVAQNLLLEATALGLGAVPIGAFHDVDVRELLRLPAGVEPLYLVAIGRPSR